MNKVPLEFRRAQGVRKSVEVRKRVSQEGAP